MNSLLMFAALQATAAQTPVEKAIDSYDACVSRTMVLFGADPNFPDVEAAAAMSCEYLLQPAADELLKAAKARNGRERIAKALEAQALSRGRAELSIMRSYEGKKTRPESSKPGR